MTTSTNNPPDKVAISIKEMAGMCGLSRQRFGQLVKAGVFPAPLRDQGTGRPYYPPELQQVCLEVRHKNCGVNGRIVMFYSARTPTSSPSTTHRQKPATKPKSPAHDRHADLLDGLHGLGLTTATGVQVREALAHLYPNGSGGMDPGQVLRTVFLYLRNQNSAGKLGREVELRRDVRANAVLHLLLYTGCRVGDVAALELGDLMLAERSGTAVFRHGKGGKLRSVPLPLPARRAIQVYLDTRPPVVSPGVFIGERGPLTDRGIRNLCGRYAAVCGFHLHTHLLRHTMAHRFLADTGNDLVALAQTLGHESLSTTARYTQRTPQQLGEASEKLNY